MDGGRHRVCCASVRPTDEQVVEVKGTETMNILTVAAVLVPIVLAVIVSFLIVGAYRKFRGKRIVTCPETGTPATVELDGGHAALTAVFGEPSLRLKACSRWPEK